MDYAIVEISGRQYKIEPGKEILVDFLGEDTKDLTVDRVLLLANGGNVQLGTPYLNQKLQFTVIGQTKNKIRVAKYHAKANTRKVTGAKVLKTRIRLAKEGTK